MSEVQPPSRFGGVLLPGLGDTWLITMVDIFCPLSGSGYFRPLAKTLYFHGCLNLGAHPKPLKPVLGTHPPSSRFGWIGKIRTSSKAFSNLPFSPTFGQLKAFKAMGSRDEGTKDSTEN